MSNPSKAKGSAWEVEIVRYLQETFPRVERRTMAGTLDRGDIAGVRAAGREVVIEAKNCKAVSLAAWVDEAEREARVGGHYNLPTVWHHRKGRAGAADGYVTMPGWAFVEMLRHMGETDV